MQAQHSRRGHAWVKCARPPLWRRLARLLGGAPGGAARGVRRGRAEGCGAAAREAHCRRRALQGGGRWTPQREQRQRQCQCQRPAAKSDALSAATGVSWCPKGTSKECVCTSRRARHSHRVFARRALLRSPLSAHVALAVGRRPLARGCGDGVVRVRGRGRVPAAQVAAAAVAGITPAEEAAARRQAAAP